MQPQRVDAAIDLAYGLLIFVAILLMLRVGSQTGIAFGIGVLVSYGLHVGWKMARFDPEWMTTEVAEEVEESVTDSVERTVSEEVQETVSKEVDQVLERVEEVDERVERRPKTDELEEAIEQAQQQEKS